MDAVQHRHAVRPEAADQDQVDDDDPATGTHHREHAVEPAVDVRPDEGHVVVFGVDEARRDLIAVVGDVERLDIGENPVQDAPGQVLRPEAAVLVKEPRDHPAPSAVEIAREVVPAPAPGDCADKEDNGADERP